MAAVQRIKAGDGMGLWGRVARQDCHEKHRICRTLFIAKVRHQVLGARDGCFPVALTLVHHCSPASASRRLPLHIYDAHLCSLSSSSLFAEPTLKPSFNTAHYHQTLLRETLLLIGGSPPAWLGYPTRALPLSPAYCSAPYPYVNSSHCLARLLHLNAGYDLFRSLNHSGGQEAATNGSDISKNRHLHILHATNSLSRPARSPHPV